MPRLEVFNVPTGTATPRASLRQGTQAFGAGLSDLGDAISATAQIGANVARERGRAAASKAAAELELAAERIKRDPDNLDTWQGRLDEVANTIAERNSSGAFVSQETFSQQFELRRLEQKAGLEARRQAVLLEMGQDAHNEVVSGIGRRFSNETDPAMRQLLLDGELREANEARRAQGLITEDGMAAAMREDTETVVRGAVMTRISGPEVDSEGAQAVLDSYGDRLELAERADLQRAIIRARERELSASAGETPAQRRAREQEERNTNERNLNFIFAENWDQGRQLFEQLPPGALNREAYDRFKAKVARGPFAVNDNPQLVRLLTRAQMDPTIVPEDPTRPGRRSYADFVERFVTAGTITPETAEELVNEERDGRLKPVLKMLDDTVKALVTLRPDAPQVRAEEEQVVRDYLKQNPDATPRELLDFAVFRVDERDVFGIRGAVPTLVPNPLYLGPDGEPDADKLYEFIRMQRGRQERGDADAMTDAQLDILSRHLKQLRAEKQIMSGRPG